MFSLLDGLSNVKRVVQRAKELGMPALGITDHGVMHGAIEFYVACKEAQITPIIGMEAYLAARGMNDRDPALDRKNSHLLLLAEDLSGYQNLIKIATAAQLDGFYYRPRIDHDFLAEHSEGLICTSGCLAAEVPQAIISGRDEEALRLLDFYWEIFGPSRFFFELQDHDLSDLHTVNKALIELSSHYDAKFVATNDVHYINQEDASLHDLLMCIRTNALLSDQKRMRMNDDSYYLRSFEEMQRIFGHVPGALENTLEIAERCQVELKFSEYRLPRFEVPSDLDEHGYLRQLCEKGLLERYRSRSNDRALRERLEYELTIIHQMGFDAYFLVVWDLCKHASQEGIWYHARGSAAGSIVAYILNITLVDPIEHGLIFERFLNPGRVSMPDIDLDFQDDRRHELLEYTARKYGEDKVAQIITFGTLKARAAIRDVGRVMDIPLNEVDRVAKLVPNVPGKPVSITEALRDVSDFKVVHRDEPHLRQMIDTASQLEGVVRNSGTHAAGVIISDNPLIEYIPLHRSTGSNAQQSVIKATTQYAMDAVESLGLLKVDFLGLRTLTVMAHACALIENRHGVTLDIHNIPTDDPRSYELMGRGDVTGVFQVEGSGMRRCLIDMKPERLEHVIAMVALYRPGPMDFIPSYIRRMHGEEAITHRHTILEPIFEETFGIPVYQEQIMSAAMDLAGYDASDADDLRKAIGKKMKDKLMEHRHKFIDGASARGLSESEAASIFDDWEEFARYGFNKAHAAEYGVIAVQTAYLKAHFPLEYATALLTAEKNDTARVATYVADARRAGIQILPPDINYSQSDFSIEDLDQDQSGIRFGLGAVKNVGNGPVTELLKGRSEGENFADLDDLCSRVDLRLVGKRALESLTKVGALDSFGTRGQLLSSADQMVSVSSSIHQAAEAGQMTMFEVISGPTSIGLELIGQLEEVPERQLRAWEKELVGVYVGDHPLLGRTDEIESVVTVYSGDLNDDLNGEIETLAGTVVHIRTHTTVKGQSMAFVTLEDLHGSVDLVVFPRTWKSVRDWLEPEQLITVSGKVDAEGVQAKLLVNTIKPGLIRMEGTQMTASVPPVATIVASQVDSDDDTLRGKTTKSHLPANMETGLELHGGIDTNPLWGVDTGGSGEVDVAPPTFASNAPVQVNAVRGEIPTGTVQRIVITLRPIDALINYKLRIKWAYNVFTSFPGKDSFAVVVYEEDGRCFELDFPNHSTGHCDELTQQLLKIVESPDDIDMRPLLL